MPSLNTTRLATNQSTLPFASAQLNLQAVREEAIGFWVHCATPTSSICQIKGAPDTAALAFGANNGMVIHTIIVTGTAAAGQTKVNAQGHAFVVIQALPIMFIRLANGTGTDVWNVYLVE